MNAFAKAKKSTYDPRVVKEKERNRASKTVNKYKKLKQRLEAGGGEAKVGRGFSSLQAELIARFFLLPDQSEVQTCTAGPRGCWTVRGGAL